MNKCLIALVFLMCITTLAAGKQIDVGAGYQFNNIADGLNAATSGDVVFVHPGTYPIDIAYLKSGVSLKGSGYDNTIIYGTSTSAGADGSKSNLGYLYGEDVSDIEISGFRFTSDASGTDDGGHGESRNCIFLRNCKNVRIHDIYAQRYLYNDMLDCRNGDNIQVYDCISKSVGHDFVEFLSGTRNSEVRNCLIDVQTNTGIRLDNTINCKITSCTIYDDTGSGWCGIEIENTMTNCVIDRCIIRNMHGSTGNAAIQYVHASGSLTVSNTVGWDTKGIAGGSPTLINTDLDASPQDESYWVSQGYGYNGNVDTVLSPITPTAPTTPIMPTTPTASMSTITSSYIPTPDPNIDELNFDVTKTDRIEPGTGKYQTILSFSSATPNYVKPADYTKSIFWYFPDNFMAQLYGSTVLEYQPSATVVVPATGVQTGNVVTQTVAQSINQPKFYM